MIWGIAERYAESLCGEEMLLARAPRQNCLTSDRIPARKLWGVKPLIDWPIRARYTLNYYMRAVRRRRTFGINSTQHLPPL